MTDPAGLDLLFDPSLISPTVRPHLGNDLVVGQVKTVLIIDFLSCY